MTADDRLLPAHEQNEQCAHQRQEGDNRKDGPAVHVSAPPVEIPGDERDHADQHGEGVVINVSGLKTHGDASAVGDARRDAIRTDRV